MKYLALVLIALFMSCASKPDLTQKRDFTFDSFVDEETLMTQAQFIFEDMDYQIAKQDVDGDKLLGIKIAELNDRKLTFVIQVEYKDDKKVVVETKVNYNLDGKSITEYYNKKHYNQEYKQYFYDFLERIESVSQGKAFPNRI